MNSEQLGGYVIEILALVLTMALFRLREELRKEITVEAKTPEEKAEDLEQILNDWAAIRAELIAMQEAKDAT